eukprot:Gregarina_sp_Poly_1__2324@NODE_1620_length_3700_cov_81_161299_g1067_i0_p4_GENE_NODE_1620_length_3700_cov_81_161299_g1067_i0NODE_1620_length_3700_cov_81_161299_g1067_i0_p4_ORF_typecomplete_len161_score20_14_NODE_1620_length_3700_cov_81_161299_g1067_i059484
MSPASSIKESPRARDITNYSPSEDSVSKTVDCEERDFREEVPVDVDSDEATLGFEAEQKDNVGTRGISVPLSSLRKIENDIPAPGTPFYSFNSQLVRPGEQLVDQLNLEEGIIAVKVLLPVVTVTEPGSIFKDLLTLRPAR